MRLSGESREQDLQVPSVQNLLRQSRLAMAGFFTHRFRNRPTDRGRNFNSSPGIERARVEGEFSTPA
jgi:hypothetical protein